MIARIGKIGWRSKQVDRDRERVNLFNIRVPDNNFSNFPSSLPVSFYNHGQIISVSYRGRIRNDTSTFECIRRSSLVCWRNQRIDEVHLSVHFDNS